MHRLRPIYLCLVLVVGLSCSANAQIFSKMKNGDGFESSRWAYKDYTDWLHKRPMPQQVPSYLDYVGTNIDLVWGFYDNDFVPIIYLDLPTSAPKQQEISQSLLKEYSQQIAQEELEEEKEEEELSMQEILERRALLNSSGELTPYPKEYKIWNNAVIDAYNVDLSESTDTIRLNISDYQSPGYKYVTSEFGWRRRRMHYGIDLKVYTGDTIRSAFDYAVVRIKRFNRRGYGNYVVLRHANGLETLYGHMSKTLVEEGDTLRVGDVVGLGGNTGRSSGSHLHFEMRYLGKPINPKIAVDFENDTLRSDILVLTASDFKYNKKSSAKKSGSKSGGGSNASGPNTITIRKGDTLGSIARRYGTTVAKLKKLNGLKGNNITAGKRLKIR